MPSYKISYGDTGYSVIHDAWIENGSPHMFERYGEWGGALYRVHDVAAENPDFYQFASLPATTFDEDSPHEYPLVTGWHLQNRDYWRLKARWTWSGRPKITRPEIPNSLSVGETL